MAKTEGEIIINEIEDISTDIIVAADNAISSNNPILVDSVNGYSINWTLSNNVNYEIVDGKISVKDYTNIDDETLTVTAYGTSSNMYYYQYTRWIAPVTHVEYRYCDRELIYTYYLTKTEAKESTTEVIETTNISNVNKWVQYRAK